MDRRTLIQANRRSYRRFYRLAGFAAALSVAVITGSLIVGDSVRRSLLQRIDDRLPGVQSVVVSTDGFFGAAALQELSLDDDSKAILLSDGFVSRDGRLIPVMVWGMDVLPDGSTLQEGRAAVNAALSKELGDEDGLALRLPNGGPVPSSSLFVTSRYTVSERFQRTAVLDAAHGGNLSLKNEQTIPYNVFIARSELCSLLGIEDKANILLTPDALSQESLQALTPETLGLHVEGDRIVSDGIFLKKNLVDKLTEGRPEADRMYSYLVNTISGNGREIPYSFATAMDRYEGFEIPAGEALLSDYAARRLGLRAGDSLTVTYYVSDALKKLSERTRGFRVARIVPLAALAADGHLSADFPGLADAESCSQWDSDLPIDLDRVKSEDEQFWTDWKSTPKILLPYAEMREEWANTWGDATEIRLSGASLAGITADDFALTALQPKEAARLGALGGVDFGGLFLGLGFFIILAALLLLYNPLSELYFRRKDEFALLAATGWTDKSVRKLLRREVLPTAGYAALAGLVAAILYAGLVLFLLGNVWSGATHTDGFRLSVKPMTVLMGALAGILLNLFVIDLAVKKAGAEKADKRDKKGRIWLPACLTILLLVAIAIGAVTSASVILFLVIGCLWMAFGIAWADFFLRRRDTAAPARKSLARQSLGYASRETMLGLVTLSLGVFITFAVGLNRKDFSDKTAFTSGTGGFDYWCETVVPIYHDLTDPAERKSAGLEALGDNALLLQCLQVSGDDASCLNLNKVSRPGILGFPEEAFLASDFSIRNNLFSLTSDREVIDRMNRSDAVYGLVDETVLTWGLMLAVGDTLHYPESDVIIAGSLPNTVFQGAVLIPERSFRQHWTPDGSKVFLVRSDNPDAGKLLETALNEYGIRATPGVERLRLFNSVTDAYLTIFLMLGGIGLLVGIGSFIIVVRKRLSGRRKEIALLRALGFGDGTIRQLLRRENLPVPVLSVFLGTTAAIVSVSLSFGAISPMTWITCLVICILLLVLAWWFIDRTARQALLESDRL